MRLFIFSIFCCLATICTAQSNAWSLKPTVSIYTEKNIETNNIGLWALEVGYEKQVSPHIKQNFGATFGYNEYHVLRRWVDYISTEYAITATFGYKYYFSTASFRGFWLGSETGLQLRKTHGGIYSSTAGESFYHTWSLPLKLSVGGQIPIVPSKRYLLGWQVKGGGFMNFRQKLKNIDTQYINPNSYQQDLPSYGSILDIGLVVMKTSKFK